MEVEPIVHNSPALDSLKHQQLRSLCARHALKSTGKRDQLIKRLKGLRDQPATSSSYVTRTTSSEPEELDGSFDFIEDATTAASHLLHLPGSFDGAAPHSTDPRPSFATSRVSTDEFGALSADAQTITRSSSWKGRLANVFGGSITSQSSSVSNKSIASSGSSGSLNSSTAMALDRTLRTSIETLVAGPSASSRNSSSSSSGSLPAEFTQPRASTSILPSRAATSASSTSAAYAKTAAVPPTPAPAFRIVEDSFTTQAGSMLPDCSYVPRSSFEGDSVDLANVPIWPPPPGVIFISPRQSPNKKISSYKPIFAHPPSSSQKRQLEEVDEGDYDDGDNDEGDLSYGDNGGDHDNATAAEGSKFGSIRMIPRSIPLSPSSTMMTPGRKIKALPKKMSLIAASPPRFDLEAPPLPSFASVAHQVMREQEEAKPATPAATTASRASGSAMRMMPGSLSASCDSQNSTDVNDSSNRTIVMRNSESPSSEAETKPSSEGDAPLAAMTTSSSSSRPFIFGSTQQQPLTDDTFLKRIDGFAIAKQMEELQRRTGIIPMTTGAGAQHGAYTISGDRRIPSDSKGLTKSGSEVRFGDRHQQEFSRMDSIANHYAAKRKTAQVAKSSISQSPNKRTRTDTTDVPSSQSSSMSRQFSHSALSSLSSSSSAFASHQQPPSLNQQGRYAPNIPPRPKNVKTSAQQAEDRERIRLMQLSAQKAQRRTAGRTSVSPRKMAANNASARKLPPLPSTNAGAGSNSIGSNASTGTASRLFKSTMTSLKSFGSSNSLASKAGSVGISTSASTRNLELSHAPDFGTLQQKDTTNATGNSLNRPTIASLARQTSRQNLDSIASSLSSKASNPSLNSALSPRSVSKEHTSTVLSPRMPGATSYSTLDKKRISSISAANRSSPLKGGLGDSIAHARKLRVKKAGQQQPPPGGAFTRSPSKTTGLHTAAAGQLPVSSTSSRPAWR